MNENHIITEELINLNGSILSLTDNQISLLKLFNTNLSDKEIASKLNLSPSTIRHQKFIFKEKAKSAKLYLALWNSIFSKAEDNSEFVPIHKGAKMIDQRYEITKQEEDQILNNVFESLDPLKLKVFSKKEKKKIVILNRISKQFEINRKYTEKEVNEILVKIYDDFATMRRYLIEYGYLKRENDCSFYWKE